MKLQTKLAHVALFLFLVFVSGFGGCFVGSKVGHSKVQATKWA